MNVLDAILSTNIIATVLAVSLIVLMSLFLIYQIAIATFLKVGIVNDIQKKYKKYIQDFNEYNAHVHHLNSAYAPRRRFRYAGAIRTYDDNRRFSGLSLRHVKNNHEYICRCSLSVAKKAEREPFKYIMKYFEWEANEKTLIAHERLLNNMLAIEDGKRKLKLSYFELADIITEPLPRIFALFSRNRLMKAMDVKPIFTDTSVYPTYTFLYRSTGGQQTMRVSKTLTPTSLRAFIRYIEKKILNSSCSSAILKKKMARERELMTPKFRQYILERDHYTCQKCHNSTYIEPNLLLEIDHIMPLSKGGRTVEENLQVLCWRCNRYKGDKLA